MSSSGDPGLIRPPPIRTAAEADLSAVATIHIASWQDAYRGVVPDRVLARRTVEGALRGWRSTFAAFPLNIRVATDESGAVKGFCCAGPVTDYEANAPFDSRSTACTYCLWQGARASALHCSTMLSAAPPRTRA